MVGDSYHVLDVVQKEGLHTHATIIKQSRRCDDGKVMVLVHVDPIRVLYRFPIGFLDWIDKDTFEDERGCYYQHLLCVLGS